MYVTRCLFCEDDRESAQIRNFANSSSFELFKNQAFMFIFVPEAFHSLSLNQLAAQTMYWPSKTNTQISPPVAQSVIIRISEAREHKY